MTASLRQNRISDFRFFSQHAQRVFGEIAALDPRHNLLEQVYCFHVVPGGGDGGYNRRVVEVFYGQRPFEAVQEATHSTGSFSPLRNRLLTEGGTALLYQRGDNGGVLCALYPAQSENCRRREDCILLDFVRGTHALTGRAMPEQHWRAFMSYMQCTSLDGDPTAADHLRVWWLLLTRRLIVDGKMQVPRLWTVAGRLALYSATVGLSGFLLAVVQWWFAKYP